MAIISYSRVLESFQGKDPDAIQHIVRGLNKEERFLLQRISNVVNTARDPKQAQWSNTVTQEEGKPLILKISSDKESTTCSCWCPSFIKWVGCKIGCYVSSSDLTRDIQAALAKIQPVVAYQDPLQQHPIAHPRVEDQIGSEVVSDPTLPDLKNRKTYLPGQIPPRPRTSKKITRASRQQPEIVLIHRLLRQISKVKATLSEEDLHIQERLERFLTSNCEWNATPVLDKVSGNYCMGEAHLAYQQYYNERHAVLQKTLDEFSEMDIPLGQMLTKSRRHDSDYCSKVQSKLDAFTAAIKREEQREQSALLFSFDEETLNAPFEGSEVLSSEQQTMGHREAFEEDEVVRPRVQQSDPIGIPAKKPSKWDPPKPNLFFLS